MSELTEQEAGVPSDAQQPVAAPDPNAAPPAGEDIHLPPGTPIPLLIAVGLTLVLVGTTVGIIWTILGGIVFLITLGIWIRDTRNEVAHLPDEHGTHH